jgi:UDP-N-acetylglucosamine--N-acetylmuramyl-(pentapeptide) pyrophosphoryl-undecaprenol N-acetylglucosamine transferase
VTAKLAVVAAGGTGGHLFPAQALAETLIGRGWRVVLATDERGATYAGEFPAEERIALSAATYRPGDPLGMARAGLAIGRGALTARTAFARLKPAVVVGFGGYPSLPSLIAAAIGGRPIVIHEQNAVMGRANRLLAGRATAVACAFPTLKKASPKVQARAVVVGNPVRPEIRALADTAYVAPSGRIDLLVTGGSQGARVVSETVPRAVAQLSQALRDRLTIQQQTRAESIESARTIYQDAGVVCELAPFFRDMAGRLAAAHLVIGRAGASTVCELAVAGKPAILIPLKIALDDDQGENAALLADAGAAVVLREQNLSVESLAVALAGLLDDPQKLAAMSVAARSVARPDAAERLADLVEKVASRAA